MTYIKRITALFLSLIMCFSLICCEDSEPTEKIYFELPEMPKTLDPQTASNKSELILVRNLFEGLLRYGKNGKLENGAAESYEKDGLTYTFRLRKNLRWDTGEKLTANDFVFGMQRAVHPKTQSPFVSRFFCIENAESIYNGKAATDTLGVRAEDERTLKITLAYEDGDFLHNLTTAPFMPCSRKFFEESIGKYGLGKQYLLCSGSYYLRKWNTEDFGIRIYKNAEYNGKFPALNAAVFFAKSKDRTPLQQLNDKKADAAFLSGSQLKKAKEAGFSASSVENICWIMTFGKDVPKQMQQAFSMLTDGSVYKFDLPYGARTADSIYPECLKIDSSVQKIGFPVYDAEKAKEIFSEAIKQTEDKKMPQTVLQYYSQGEIKDTVTAIAGHWQQNLSAFVNIEECTNAELLTGQLTDAQLQMAVFPITAESASIKDYLSVYGKASDSSTPAAIQKEILSGGNIIPLAFDSTSVAYSSSLSEIVLQPGNGYIDFALIKKN